MFDVMDIPPLPLTFYQQSDVLYLSQALLGKYLLTSFNGVITGGQIIETEAYRGPEDRASHAYGNRRTKRNEAMFLEGGISYVYLCYGIHSLFNVVTNTSGIPHAILIRAIKPEIGVEEMMKRRKKTKLDRSLTQGPGALCQALGINTSHNRLPLNQPPLWIEDRGLEIDAKQIIASPRIGIDYAGEDAHLPWRFQSS